jgi:hypothetical protein
MTGQAFPRGLPPRIILKPKGLKKRCGSGFRYTSSYCARSHFPLLFFLVVFKHCFLATQDKCRGCLFVNKKHSPYVKHTPCLIDSNYVYIQPMLDLFGKKIRLNNSTCRPCVFDLSNCPCCVGHGKSIAFNAAGFSHSLLRKKLHPWSIKAM